MMDRPRYNSLNRYLRKRFKSRVAKISLDAGFNCPNRDGSISSKGCIFCDAKGSGTGFHSRGISVTDQIAKAMPWLAKRYDTEIFIAYFQAYTNTYAPVAELEKIYAQALEFDQIRILALGTRPDCLSRAKLELLARINQEKEVWLELGLQSSHNKTLRLINRGHDFETFLESAEKAVEKGLMVFAHLILGLPGEGFEEAARTVERLAGLGLAGVKIHGLYVTKDAPLARMYKKGNIRLLTRKEFVDMICGLIPLLPQDWIIQRLVSDPGRWILVAPDWMLAKKSVLREIEDRLERLDIRQGQALA